MLEKWFGKDQGEGSKKKYLILAIGMVIIGLIITYLPTGQKKTQAQTAHVQTGEVKAGSSDYEATLEKRLASILVKMEGVGGVSVMITTASNDEKVLAQNITDNVQRTEEKTQGETSRLTETDNHTHQVVMQSGNTPYVIKENKPEIKGVLILAEGADNSEVKNQLIEAVSKLLDIPVHKVSVVKKEM